MPLPSCIRDFSLSLPRPFLPSPILSSPSFPPFPNSLLTVLSSFPPFPFSLLPLRPSFHPYPRPQSDARGPLRGPVAGCDVAPKREQN